MAQRDSLQNVVGDLRHIVGCGGELNGAGYRLRKAPKRNLYWVVAIDGRHLSKKPLPLSRAKAQLRAVYANEGNQRRGLKGIRGGQDEPSSDLPTFNDYLQYKGFEEAPATTIETAPGQFRAITSPTDVINFDETLYNQLMSRLPSQEKWLQGYTRRGLQPKQTYDEYRSAFEQAQRRRATKNISESQRVQSSLSNLQQKNELYKEYIALFPEAEEVMCPINDKLETVPMRTTKAKCATLKKQYEEEWEKKNHPANYYFFRPAVKGIIDATSFLSNLPFIPKPLGILGSTVADYARQATEGSNPTMSGGGGNKPSRKFAIQLEKWGITPDDYLSHAKKKAKALGLVDNLLGFSSDEKHKLQIPNADGKIIRFGATGLGDYILYTLSNNPKAAQHRKRYLARAKAIKGDWANDPYSPNSLAIGVLW